MDELNFNIKNAKNILILTHINPDGDALGSMCAMYGIISKNFKRTADMLVLSKISKNYEYLPFIKNIKTLKDIDTSVVYDVVILVDVASLDRIADARILYDKAKYKVNFDHHKTNNGYGDFVCVKGEASSCGEVIYDFTSENNWGIDLDIANSLYTSILTDTGGFRFENTSANALKIASELVKIGVKPMEIYKKCYETKTKGLVLFQSYCISKAEFVENDRIAYIVIYKKDLEKFAAKEDYTEGLAETLRAIDTTEISFVLKELDSRTYKVSMRSKKIDIANVCKTFNGGGHTFAAGCTIKSNAKDAINKLLTEIKKQGF